jgi:DNA-binding transcriptional regulator YiaG
MSRRHIPTKRRPRKAFPTTLQTPGDHIRLKRLEKGLTQKQLAQMLHVPVRHVQWWETNVKTPDGVGWSTLACLLNPSERPNPANPTAE